VNLSRLRRPGRRARRVAVVVVALTVVGSGYAAYAANADDPSYRTATATIADVEETLDLSGTIEPAGRADLSFATSGSVESVRVRAGQTVRAGQVLASLDDTSLRKDVQQARATLAAARAQLEDDENAQAETVSAAAGATDTGQPQQDSGLPAGQPSGQPGGEPTQEPSGEPSEQPDGPDLSDVLAELAEEQQAVTTAQSTVSASLASAKAALAAQQAACADAFSGTGDGTDDGTGDGTDDGTGGQDQADQACTDALGAVQSAQEQVASDQDALQDTLDALAGTLGDAVAELQSTGSATSASTASFRTSAGGSSASTGIVLTAAVSTTTPTTTQGTSGTGVSTTVTAATLAQDQAAIDQARADLVSARQSLRTARITAPFGGEVVSVDAQRGDSVASGTEVLVLVSRGTTTVEVDADSTQVQQLEVGQHARVTPAGAERALAGTVTQVSSVPDDSSSYPVTITLTRHDLNLATGLTASVSVVTGTADDVLTVPASAVSDGVVEVVEDGGVSRARVTTGVVGATRVEVTDGLAEGDVVVLADLDEALPSGDSDSRGGFGQGDFGGGFGTGGPPAGMTPPTR